MVHVTFYSSVLCSASSVSSLFPSSDSRLSSAGFYKIHIFETIETSYPTKIWLIINKLTLKFPTTEHSNSLATMQLLGLQ